MLYWTEPLTSYVIRVSIIDVLRFLQRVQVVEDTGVLIKTVHRRQVLVAVTEVVFAELRGGIAVVLQQLGDGRILMANPLLGCRHTDLRQPGAKGNLAGNKPGTTGRAALLGIIVGEQGAFIGDAVDIGRFVPHHAAPQITRMLGFLLRDLRDLRALAGAAKQLAIISTANNKLILLVVFIFFSFLKLTFHFHHSINSLPLCHFHMSFSFSFCLLLSLIHKVFG